MSNRNILTLALQAVLLATAHGAASAQQPVKTLDTIQVTGTLI